MECQSVPGVNQMSNAIAQHLISLIFLVLNSIIDVKYRKISIVLCLFFGMVSFAYLIYYSIFDMLSLLLGVLPGGFLVMISRITRESIGIGDGVVVIILGLINGGMKNITILMYALFLSALFSVGLLLIKKISKKESIPFIPFLLIAYILVMILEGSSQG